MIDIIRLIAGVLIMVGMTVMMNHRPAPQEQHLLMAR